MKVLCGFAILCLGLSFAGTGVRAAAPSAATSHAAAPAAQPATRTWAVKHFQTCAACHGAHGAHPMKLPGNPPPIIAGQYESYLIQALKEYRDGQRKNAIMAPQAKAMTDAQIVAIAAYISSLPTPLHMLPRPDFGHWWPR